MSQGDDRLSDRLMSRSMGLARRQMPGGGEAYSGPLANQALGALGARAMTMDKSVFVQEGFNAQNPDDLALWAHESHHQNESGGSDNHSEYDSEEQAARARERLVLHQAGAGQNPDDILAGLGSANPKNAKEADDIFAAEAGTGSTDSSGEPEPMEAYRNMLKDGMSHDNVVRMLAEQVMQSLAHMENEEEVRAGSRID